MPLLIPGTTTPTPVPPEPPPVTPAPDTTWGGLGVTWTGWDGSEWELASPTSPVWLTPRGTRGLSMPPVTRHTSASPAVAGARFRGYHVPERPVFWPVFVYADSTADWLAVDRAWWRTMHPDRVGVWTIAQPDGTRRRLTCRYADDGGHVFGRDPAATGWQLYGVELVAEDPFWRGDPVHREFAAGGAGNFYGPTPPTSAPPFIISPSSTSDEAELDNPGDEPAWPVWTLHGPWTTATAGVAGQLVQIPFSLTAGKWLRIDTRPDQLTVTDSDGNDRVDDLGAVAFGHVEPGDAVPLTITWAGATDDTSAAVDLEPLYHRAW